MPKISVIIPVYNVVQYLPKCLDSVINQTFKDIEIICIDDCSADGSLAILKEYAEKDRRIKVIELTQNKGVSYSRNKGIENSNGEYILFLDSDDWLEYDLIEVILKEIAGKNCDFGIFCYNYYSENKFLINKKQLDYILSNYSKKQSEKTYNNQLVNCIWDKIYRTEFIKNNHLKFSEQLSQAEDVLFVLELLSYKPNILYIPKSLYYYRIGRADSAMNKNPNLVEKQITAFKQMLKCDFYNNAARTYKQFCINTFLGGIIYFYMLSVKNKTSFDNLIKLRKLRKCMEANIPEDILNENKEFMILNNIISINPNRGVSCLKYKKGIL